MTERMCIVSRTVMNEDELLRLVKGPDGAIVPDLARKLPGRGVWVGLSRARLAEAVRRKLFARALGEDSKTSPELPDIVSGLLRRQAVSLISLAKKAGEAVTGFEKVEDKLTRGEVRVLLHASEAKPDGCRKLDRLAAPWTIRINAFYGSELDLAFGRANVVHAAVAKGGLAEKLLEAVGRMEKYEAPEGAKVS